MAALTGVNHDTSRIPPARVSNTIRNIAPQVPPFNQTRAQAIAKLATVVSKTILGFSRRTFPPSGTALTWAA